MFSLQLHTHVHSLIIMNASISVKFPISNNSNESSINDMPIEDMNWRSLIESWKEMNTHMKITRKGLEVSISTIMIQNIISK